MNPDIFSINNKIFDTFIENNQLIFKSTNEKLNLKKLLYYIYNNLPFFINRNVIEYELVPIDIFLNQLPILLKEKDIHVYSFDNKIILPKKKDLSHFSILLCMFGIQLTEETYKPELDLERQFNTILIHYPSLKLTITDNEFDVQFTEMNNDLLKCFYKIGKFLSTYNIKYVIEKTHNNDYKSRIFDNFQEAFEQISTL